MQYFNAQNMRQTYNFLCLAATIAMASWCLYQYSLDEDVTLIDFKSFHASADDIYPTVLMCFYNPYVDIYLDNYGKKINVTAYKYFLQGKLSSKEMINIDYEKVTLDINDYFLGYEIMYTNNTIITYDKFGLNEENAGWKLPYAYFNSPYAKCFTLDIPFEREMGITKLGIKLKTGIFPQGIRPDRLGNIGFLGSDRAAAINPNDTDGFAIIMYYPKQLFPYRSNGLLKNSWPQRTENSSKNYAMHFTVQNIEMIKLRNKRARPCIQGTPDFDTYLFEDIMKSVGCRPPYWSSRTHLNVCSTDVQMKKIRKLYLEHSMHRDVRLAYLPCRRLINIQYEFSEIDHKETQPPYFMINVWFVNSKYREIKMVSKFDAQTLIGNIGGYIGIFVGYTLLNLPDLVIKLVRMGRQRVKSEIENDNAKKDEEEECHLSKNDTDLVQIEMRVKMLEQELLGFKLKSSEMTETSFN